MATSAYDHLKPEHQPFPVPSKAGNLVTLVDRCWICDNKFTDFGGTDHTLVQEFHHIIPRAYGGLDGPTVSLCSGHHTTLHDIAQKLISGRPYFEFLTKDPLIDKRLLYLATRVQNAHATFSNDPNKRLVLTASITKAEVAMMEALYPVYKVRSREALFHHILKEVYERHFPVRRRQLK